MAAIVELYPLSPAIYQDSGSFPGARSVLWHCEVDEQMDGGAVIQFAMNAGLPRRGSVFSYTSPSGYKWTDPDCYALDYSAEPVFSPDEDNQTKWTIRVGYRAPAVGQDEFPANINLAPLSRPPEYWIEYATDQSAVSTGYLVSQSGSVASTRTYLTNAAGQIYDSIFATTLKPVIVAAYNVDLLLYGIQLTERYENTTNANEIWVLGKRVKAHYARFLRADTSRVWETGRSHVRMEVRLELSKTPYYTTFPNEGDYALVSTSPGAGTTVPKASDGTTVPGPIRLRANGTADNLDVALQSNSASDRERKYLLLNPVTYHALGSFAQRLPFGPPV